MNNEMLTNGQGYRIIRQPEHPRAYSNGYVMEHVLVAERALGKPLPLAAVVHHVNGNRTENANTNLVICENDAYHQTLHKRQRVLDGGGHPGTHKWCTTCKTVLPMTEFHRGGSSRSDGLNASCKPCNSTKGRSVQRACQVCGVAFFVKPIEAKRGGGVACSVLCRNRYINKRRAR